MTWAPWVETADCEGRVCGKGVVLGVPVKDKLAIVDFADVALLFIVTRTDSGEAAVCHG